MFNKPVNLVFEGGGALGIAYLGVLHYLYQNNIFQNVKRVAGTSAGAITACITSFNLPFGEIKKLVDTLDFKKVPEKDTNPDLNKIPAPILDEFEKIFPDFECVYRLIKNYGWYSSEYFYNWIQKQIESQFDHTKKLPPYTFADFKNSYIHNGNRPFIDLYIIGTDLSYRSSKIFSYETTPDMEVAEAVRISMSIPLFFEAIKTNEDTTAKYCSTNVFCDGGLMWNYPINIFDSMLFNENNMPGINYQTLGARFLYKIKYYEINSLINFVKNLHLSQLNIQQDIFNHSPQDIQRSIQIFTGDISPVDFDISTGDETYHFLYNQGYKAAKIYFDNIMYSRHIRG